MQEEWNQILVLGCRYSKKTLATLIKMDETRVFNLLEFTNLPGYSDKHAEARQRWDDFSRFRWYFTLATVSGYVVRRIKLNLTNSRLLLLRRRRTLLMWHHFTQSLVIANILPTFKFENIAAVHLHTACMFTPLCSCQVPTTKSCVEAQSFLTNKNTSVIQE